MAPPIARQTSMPLGQRAAKIRALYLKDARRDIESRLAASVHHARFIDLGIRDDPTAVRPPWGYYNPEAGRSYESIGEAFAGCDRRLLLLGQPGSGKTTALLYLVKQLIGEAEVNSDAPVPLVLNMSSVRIQGARGRSLWERWGNRRANTSGSQNGAKQDTAFEDWVVHEMGAFPGLKRDMAREWLREGRVAVLLDGLDEVNDERRGDVVALLNTTFLHDYPDIIVVICSRTNEYEPLKSRDQTRLQLRGCVHLQPLSDPQIAAYLSAAQADGLLRALPNDAALQELARTPLTLSMLVLAYGGLAPGEHPATCTLSERRHDLFESYVARMLQRQARRKQNRPFDDCRANDVSASSYLYRPQDVDRWLGWLALLLSTRMRTTFTLRRFHGILHADLERDSQRANLWAVNLALGVFLWVSLLIAAMPMIPFTQAGLGYAALILLGLCTMLPVARSATYRSEQLGGFILVIVAFLYVGALTRAVSAGFHLNVPLLPLSVITLGTTAAGFCLLLAIITEDGRKWSLLVVGVVGLAYGVRLVPGLSFLNTAWSQAAIIALGLGAAIAIAGLRTTDQKLRDAAVAFAICIGIAGCSMGATWLIGELTWARALILLGATSVAVFANLTSRDLCTAVGLVAICAVCGFGGAIVGRQDGLVIGMAGFGLIYAVSGILLAIRNVKERRWVQQVMSQGSGARQKLLQTIDCLILGPCMWWFIAAGRRFPWHGRDFVLFCKHAFLLKQSSQEYEFVHRLLRDYFALRDLLPHVASSDWGRRMDTIRSLGYQGESALDVLAEIADHQDASVRAAALAAIGHIPSPVTTRCLEHHLDDAVPEVRRAIIPGLLSLPSFELEEFLKRFHPLGDGCEVDPLLTFLRKTSSRRSEISGILSHLGASAVGPLLGALSDRDAVVRKAVAEALGRLNVPRAVGPLLARLRDRDAGVRKAVAEALGGLGDPRSVEPLLGRLGDRDGGVCIASIKALGRLGDSRALQPLLGRLGDSRVDARTRDDGVRIASIEALGRLGDSRALQPLLARLGDSRDEARIAVALALGRLGDVRAVEPLVGRLDDPDIGFACSVALALAMLKDARGAAAMKSFLTGQSGWRRMGAVRFLAQSRDSIDRALLSLDIDGFGPGIDPAVPINSKRIAESASKLRLTEGDVRARYQALAPDFYLRIEV